MPLNLLLMLTGPKVQQYNKNIYKNSFAPICWALNKLGYNAEKHPRFDINYTLRRVEYYNTMVMNQARQSWV
jgi:lipoate-protein ligase A